MTFTVEDGTGVANANSLCSIADADAYFVDRGVSLWSGPASSKQQALVRATDYIQTRWGRKLRGSLALADQALCFPRSDIDEDDVVPSAVKKACAELALRALSASLEPDPVADASGRNVKRSKKRIEGAVEIETEYTDSLSVAAVYPVPQRLMAPYLLYAGGTIR